MTSLQSFNFLTDAQWTGDREAVTHLRNPVTLSWVEMKPPVPFEAFVYVDENCFWRRFGKWCLAAWELGHCVPQELPAGPVINGRGGWIPGELAEGTLHDPAITCAACHHTAPSMKEVAWQPDWKQWRCTDPAACHKRQQEAGMEGGLHGPA